MAVKSCISHACQRGFVVIAKSLVNALERRKDIARLALGHFLLLPLHVQLSAVELCKLLFIENDEVRRGHAHPLRQFLEPTNLHHVFLMLLDVVAEFVLLHLCYLGEF